jgi:hypothetical protein
MIEKRSAGIQVSIFSGVVRIFSAAGAAARKSSA